MATLLKRFLLLGLALTTACTDWVSTSPSEADVAPLPTPAFNVAVPACAAYSDARVQQLINIVYSQQLQASASIGITFWDRIKAAGSKNNPPISWDFVDDILTRKQTLGAPATDEMKELVNRVFCNARVAASFPGGDGWVIRPTEGGVTQNLVNTARFAAFVVPAGRITSTTGPRLFTISPSVTTSLNTPLDQYGTSQEFSVYPASTIFARAPIIVGLCGGAPDPTVVPQLQLGHRKSNGVFEVLPTTSTINQQVNDLLNCFSIATGSSTDQVGCEIAIAAAPTQILDRLWAALLPSRAFAATTTGGCGGIGGNLSELSPVRPVDPVLVLSPTTQISGSPAPLFPVWSSPAISLKTRKGTAISGVPLAISVTGGGVSIPSSGVSTAINGAAAVNFWTLGTNTATQNTLTITPGIGGARVANTIVSPASITFSATSATARAASAPTQAVFATLPTRHPITSALNITVYVRNSGNANVIEYTGPVRLTSTALAAPLVVQANRGVATFTVNFRTKAKFTFTAAAGYNGTTLSKVSTAVTVY